MSLLLRNLAFSTLSIESHLIPKNYVYWNIVVYSASIKEQIYKRRLRMPMNNISKWFTLGPISRLKNSSYTSCYALNLCWLILIIILFGYAQAVLFLQLNSVPLSELYVWMAKIHPVYKNWLNLSKYRLPPYLLQPEVWSYYNRTPLM